ncbi:unnamed protein product [Dicrocoelium dendriticum]|nr:unnamed protein product [Dicrocoelium dendriticum]
MFRPFTPALFTPKRSDFSPRLKKNQPYVVKINDDAELRYYSDHSPSNSFFMDQMSNPAPNIEWRRKGDPQPILDWEPPPHSTLDLAPLIDLAQTPRIYVLRGRHLVVRQVSEDDSGTYEMILTNVAGRVSVTFDLLVTYPPEFFQPLTLSEHAYDEDEPVSLNCGVKRRTVPGSTVVWEKDQRLLKKHKNSLMTFDDNDETLHFPKLKPEDQGHYQCFVQTDGYKNRAPGRETRLIVKGKLQFLREFTEHFLELNTQGRIPCKARGYGTLQINWYRKYGPLNTDLHPIRPPNQVEADGTLIIPFVQKSDSGEYMCVAQSTYKDASINMTIQVLVGGECVQPYCP